MCGFVGIIHYNQSSGDEHSFLEWALNDLRRRGPDQQSIWNSSDGRIHMGFARLAIRDLTDMGKQPMVSDDGRYVLMYNGETYNTDELLKWSGIQMGALKGHSDTEVILKCMEAKGIIETLTRMDGIFAIALLDTCRNHLYLIRDHAGVKPLYAGINDKGIVFSSHYHHITNHPYFRDQPINAEALANYFRYGFIQAGEGLLYQTYFLPHSHITEIDLNAKTWSFDKYTSPGSILPGKNLASLYSEIVSSQLVSDVSTGTFLSGGVDSSITTAMAAKAQPNIIAYTIGVHDEQLDEANEAARFASYFKVNHKIKYIFEKDILDSIEQFDDSLAEPLADFSSLITLKVCEAAKQDLTVVLSGDGGDELFYGYPRFYRAAEYFTYLKQPRWLRLWMISLARLQGIRIPFRLLKFDGFLDYYLSTQGLPGNNVWLNKIIKNLPKAFPAYSSKEYSQPGTCAEAMQLARQIEYDIHMQRVLLKVDRAGMYHSLEVRTPLLSTRMVDSSLKYQLNDCYNGMQGKVPLRKILRSLLPENAPDSGDKKGFSPPLAHWLRTTLRERFDQRLRNVPLVLQTYINEKGIELMWKKHLNKEEDNAWPLWAIYALFVWVDKKMYSF